MPGWVLLAAALGAGAALAGGYWDDAWHTERGRDAFLIAPHIAIYAGVAGVGGALGVWLALLARRRGVRAVLGEPTLALAAVSVGATLASGPIDNAWHEAFGRDAVIWSPPHMLGIVGTLGLGAALLAHVGRRALIGPLVGGLVIAAATFAVVEYETDVPQFDSVWYLPVLGLGAAIAVTLVRLTSPRPWAASAAAGAHLLFVAGIGGFLLLLGFEGPQLPLLILPVAALELAVRRGWRAPLQAGAFVGVLYATYAPARNVLGGGVRLDLADVLIGAPLALLAVAGVLSLASPPESRPAGPAGVALALITLLLVLPAPAAAHDPGQGSDAGTVALTATSDGQRVSLRGRLRSGCGEVRGGDVVARRGGRALRAPLRLSGCAFAGRLRVPEPGRWFVYAELERAAGTIESWLPLEVGDGARRVSEDARYAYEPPAVEGGTLKYLGGALLYAAMAGLVVAMFALLRAGSRPAAR